MVQLYAQPYDISANGFYFDSADNYASKAENNRNAVGDTPEEYEIQFIDGEPTDCDLAKAWSLSQANFAAFLDAASAWSDDQKYRYIIAVGKCGYAHEQLADDPDHIDLTLYEVASMRELAEQFIDEGIFGEIPASLQNYIDYDAVARDLAIDHAEITIGGINFVYRCH